jgi:hypothetical protein
VTTPLYQSNDYAPAAGKPKALTFQASAPILGGQTVFISGHMTVAPTNTNQDFRYAGVAGEDAGTGDDITVLTGAGVIHETGAHTPLSAGEPVQGGGSGMIAGGPGSAAAGTGAGIGIALQDVAVDHDPCRWIAFR